MEITPVPVLFIPFRVQTPVAVIPSVPITMELTVLVLPMTLDEMVKLAVPAVLIPRKVYPMAAPPPVLMEPIVLFCMDTVRFDVA